MTRKHVKFSYFLSNIMVLLMKRFCGIIIMLGLFFLYIDSINYCIAEEICWEGQSATAGGTFGSAGDLHWSDTDGPIVAVSLPGFCATLSSLASIDHFDDFTCFDETCDVWIKSVAGNSYVDVGASFCSSQDTEDCYEHYVISLAMWDGTFELAPNETAILAFTVTRTNYDPQNTNDDYIALFAAPSTPVGDPFVNPKEGSYGIWLPNEYDFGNLYQFILSASLSVDSLGCPDETCHKLNQGQGYKLASCRIEAHGYKACNDINNVYPQLESLSCKGITIQICSEKEGIRIKRIKDGSEGYIGGCYFPDGKNAPYVLADQKRFRWANYNNTSTIADFYTYDCTTDTVEKRRYTNTDYCIPCIDPKGELSGGQILYSGPPPADSAVFNSVPLSSSKVATVKVRQALSPTIHKSESASETTTIGPGASIINLGLDGREWYYGLIGSDIIGTIISSGDTITFEGSEIIGGYISENASTVELGGWGVKESSPGKVIFEATKSVRFMDMATGFIIVGAEDSVMGEINYTSVGNWIGLHGDIPGPSKTNYTISGNVTLNDVGLTDVTISLAGSGAGVTTTDDLGNYSFGGLVNGDYTITPNKTGYTFTPSSRQVTIVGGNVTGVNFTAASFQEECSTWSDVIGKYNAYVSGQAQWSDVINCYNQYVSP